MAMFPERSERIEALIGLAEQYDSESAAGVPRDDAHRVPGCESEVFLAVVRTSTGIEARFAVDNPQGISAMALAVLLAEGVKGATLPEIAAIDEDVVYEVFGRELSMGKSMGLTGMVRMLRQLAASE